MLRFFALSLFLALRVWAYVDISPIEIGENPGTSGSLALSLSNQRGNTELFEIGADANVRYDSNATFALWLLGSYNYTDVPGAEVENRGYVHLRYLRRFTATLYGETFLQTEANKLREIENRSLVGAGTRWRYYDHERFGRAYLGTGLLYERLRFSNADLDPDQYNLRFSIYMLHNKTFSNGTTLNGYLFCQPRVEEVSDYNLHTIVEFQTPIVENFFLLLRFALTYDATPPKNNDVRSYDLLQKVALMWKF